MSYFAAVLLVAGLNSGYADDGPLSLKTLADASKQAEAPPDAVKFFNTKVHAILQNTCANCHSSGKAGSFSLVMTRTTPKLVDLQQNMAAALSHVDNRKPSRSGLLSKAISAHGGRTQPPIRDANTQAFHNLEAWVKLVADESNTAPLPAIKPTPTKSSTDFAESLKPEQKRDEAVKDPFDAKIFNRMNRSS